MMRRSKMTLIGLVCLILAMLACAAPGASSPDATATFGAALTEAFATAQAANLPPPGAGSATASATAAPSATQPAAQGTQVKPSDTPAPSNTPGAQGCSDGSQYVADVTIPDNSVLQPGQAFTKTWRIQNSGTCTWTTAYQFAFAGDQQMGGQASVPIAGNVAPGSQLDVSVNLIAPTTPGTYKGSWRLKNAAGQFFGTTPFVQIVVPAPTATSTLTPTLTHTPGATASATTDPGAVAANYNGNWYNDDVSTSGVTQIVINAVNATQISVRAWGRCHPTDCDWGTGTANLSGNAFTVNNFPGAPGASLVLSIPAPNKLRAVYTSGGSGPFTYDFHIGPVAGDWVGTWVNANASTNNITRIIITASGNQISLHPYGKCTPSDCDWGTKSFAYANPLNTGSEFGHNLVITFVRANEITVQDNTVTQTENFRR